MPSIHIHLAIAERYVEKHEINNKNELLEGSIAPDFVRPKSISHYSVIRKEKVSVMQKLNDSANLRNYLKENEIKSDFDRGYALHILADELFFKEFFTEEYFEKHTEEEFFQNLYESYDALNLYLIEKYNIEISDDPNEIFTSLAKKFNYFEKDGEIDYEKISNKVYNDLVSGALKGVTFDRWKK